MVIIEKKTNLLSPIGKFSDLGSIEIAIIMQAKKIKTKTIARAMYNQPLKTKEMLK